VQSRVELFEMHFTQKNPHVLLGGRPIHLDYRFVLWVVGTKETVAILGIEIHALKQDNRAGFLRLFGFSESKIWTVSQLRVLKYGRLAFFLRIPQTLKHIGLPEIVT
jgi:hypothetical protein